MPKKEAHREDREGERQILHDLMELLDPSMPEAR